MREGEADGNTDAGTDAEADANIDPGDDARSEFVDEVRDGDERGRGGEAEGESDDVCKGALASGFVELLTVRNRVASSAFLCTFAPSPALVPSLAPGERLM